VPGGKFESSGGVSFKEEEKVIARDRKGVHKDVHKTKMARDSGEDGVNGGKAIRMVKVGCGRCRHLGFHLEISSGCRGTPRKAAKSVRKVADHLQHRGGQGRKGAWRRPSEKREGKKIV